MTAGFEPVDILQAVLMLLRQLAEGRCAVENQYRRVVSGEGNRRALELLREAFVVRPHFEWRGLGFIAQSALAIAPEFAPWDAELRYEVPGVRIADPKACQCGEVLKGAIRPWECKVFGTACTPETPIGTCMVSSEGACAAYYNYGRYSAPVPHPCPRQLMPSDDDLKAREAVLARVESWRRRAPRLGDDTITMAHGAGGRASHSLLEAVIRPAFSNPVLDRLEDGAVLEIGHGRRLAVTTDAFVVTPRRFGGGSIGDLAVNGTINDLAAMGADPAALAVSLVLEEGLAVDELRAIVADLARAADRAGVEIVTGDTKGRRAGSRRRLLHHHHRRRAGPSRGPPGRCDGPADGCDHRVRHDRRPRGGGDGCTRRPSAGCRRSIRHCAATPAGVGAARCRARDPVAARPDTWRRGVGVQRARHGLRARRGA